MTATKLDDDDITQRADKDDLTKVDGSALCDEPDEGEKTVVEREEAEVTRRGQLPGQALGAPTDEVEVTKLLERDGDAITERPPAPPPATPDILPLPDLFDDEALTQQLDPLVSRARQRVGQVLREKWRLDVLLGVGGMGAVYASTHRNGSRVAIKMLHHELLINPQVRGRFLREGYVANAVGHDGVVHVIDDDTADDGSPFLVTELLDGETLEERRVRFGGKLSEDEVLWLTDQLLDVLSAAHARGIVHRDLKPENVFLTRRGVVKVLDFGIARLRELSTASTATQAGASMGTPQYMPPEQARGLWSEVDARSDLWAVGAIMFNLLSGKLVHDGRTTNEALMHAMTKAAVPVATVAPNVSPLVARLVDKALAFERENRWRDAGRLQEALRAVYADRYGAQISTAPKLTVPENVPNKSLRPPKGPTTAQPVTGWRATTTVGRLRPSTTTLVAVAFGAAGLTIAALTVALAWGGHSATDVHTASAPPASASAASTPAAPSAPQRISMSTPPPMSSVPGVAVTDLPVVTGSVSAAPTVSTIPLPADPYAPDPYSPPATRDLGPPRPTARAQAQVAPPAPTTGGLGGLTIVCQPPCSDVVDNGSSLGPSPIFAQGVPAGSHTLVLTSGAVKKILKKTVVAGKTTEVRQPMSD